MESRFARNLFYRHQPTTAALDVIGLKIRECHDTRSVKNHYVSNFLSTLCPKTVARCDDSLKRLLRRTNPDPDPDISVTDGHPYFSSKCQ